MAGGPGSGGACFSDAGAGTTTRSDVRRRARALLSHAAACSARRRACRGRLRAGRRRIAPPPPAAAPCYSRRKCVCACPPAHPRRAHAPAAVAAAASPPARAVRFRPCIDIHQGKVKQIVGSTLRDHEGGRCAAPARQGRTACALLGEGHGMPAALGAFARISGAGRVCIAAARAAAGDELHYLWINHLTIQPGRQLIWPRPPPRLRGPARGSRRQRSPNPNPIR